MQSSNAVPSSLSQAIKVAIQNQDPHKKSKERSLTGIVRLPNKTTSIVAVIPPVDLSKINASEQYEKIMECYLKIFVAILNDHPLDETTISIPIFGIQPQAPKAAIQAYVQSFKSNQKQFHVKFVIPATKEDPNKPLEPENLRAYGDAISKVNSVKNSLNVEVGDICNEIDHSNRYLICPVREFGNLALSQASLAALKEKFKTISAVFRSELTKEESQIAPLLEEYANAIRNINWSDQENLGSQILNVFVKERNLNDRFLASKHIKSLDQAFQQDLKLFSRKFAHGLSTAKMLQWDFYAQFGHYKAAKTKKFIDKAEQAKVAFLEERSKVTLDSSGEPNHKDAEKAEEHLLTLFNFEKRRHKRRMSDETFSQLNVEMQELRKRFPPKNGTSHYDRDDEKKDDDL